MKKIDMIPMDYHDVTTHDFAGFVLPVQCTHRSLEAAEGIVV